MGKYTNTSSHTATAVKKTQKAAAKSPVKGKPAPAPRHTPTHTELRRRSEAPKPVTTHTHTANDERRREVAKAEAKERAKAAEQNLKAENARKVKADILSGLPVSAARLSNLTAEELHGICREYGRGKDARFVGHSALKKDELVKYIATGERPAVEKKPANVGTMQYNLDLLRARNGGKGYTKSDTEKCKAMFGVSVSALKAAQVAQLVKALGLSK